MSRNGAGNYSLPAPYPSGFANGTTIDAPTMNTVFQDVQTALTASTAADGQTPISGNWAFAGYSLTGVGTLTATAATFGDLSTSNGATVGNQLVVTKGGATITAGGLTVTAGGATVTAGGLTVKAGGGAVTGNSTVTGTLTVSDVLTASKGATLGGNSSVTGTLTVSSTIGAAAGSKAGEVVIFDQFPVTAATTGTTALPSGLIIKWGTGTYTAGTGSVTFAANFPNALLNVQCTLTTAGAAHGSYPPGPQTSTYAVSGFTVYGGIGQSGTFSWLAIGH